jgi:small GTP-binding protein
MSGLPPPRPHVKVVIVGHAGVGKTCLISALLKRPFDPVGATTISPAYRFQDIIRSDGSSIRLQIWDTAGQERYQSVSQLFYRDAAVALLCFEARSDSSMDTIPDWVEKVRSEVPECHLIFVGTKGDLLKTGDAESVHARAAQVFAKFANKECYITSSVTREGVDDVFRRAADAFGGIKCTTNLAKDIAEQTGAGTKEWCCSSG